jgi:hypothetical protein
MNKFQALKTLAALALGAAAFGAAQAQVGISIGVRQPGVYGRIDIGGGLPPPALVLPQPVLIAPPPVAVPRAPIYLYVSPVEQQNWRRYCGRYSACGQPVYFVRDQWVRDRYTERHPGWDRRGPGRGRDWDHRGPGDRGRGHDRGHDHDRGR